MVAHTGINGNWVYSLCTVECNSNSYLPTKEINALLSFPMHHIVANSIIPDMKTLAPKPRMV